MGTYCITEDSITILVKKESYKLSLLLDIGWRRRPDHLISLSVERNREKQNQKLVFKVVNNDFVYEIFR